MGNSRSSVIKEKLEQPATGSKKALYAACASIAVLVVFIGSALLILSHAEVAKDIVELATTSIMAFMALAVTIITGQAAFDWKAISALQHIDDDQKIDSNAQAPEVEVNQRVYKAKYFDDHILPK
jgi:heme/copper-type cytochrome/quinol oxidase subunit 2